MCVGGGESIVSKTKDWGLDPVLGVSRGGRGRMIRQDWGGQYREVHGGAGILAKSMGEGAYGEFLVQVFVPPSKSRFFC